MEYKQNEYSFSRCSSAFFLGIVFVLVPVSLSADLVYDREVIIHTFIICICFYLGSASEMIHMYWCLEIIIQNVKKRN